MFLALAMAEACKQAVSLLVERIQGTRVGPQVRVQPPFEIVARASTVDTRSATP